MHTRSLMPITCSAVLAMAACRCGPEPLDLAGGCNPLLAGHDCTLPFPSDYFLVDDASMPSGRRIELGEPAKIWTKDGRSANVNDWKPVDGFSRFPPILALLGVEVTRAGLAGIFDDYAATASAQSRTVIVDAASKRFVPHFVDLDGRASDKRRQAIVLRPMIALEEQTRYIVALQGIEQPGGDAAPAPEGFRRLRDDDVGDDPLLAPLRERYQAEIFPLLEELGLDRAGLQLAWDFTTGSEAFFTGDMLRVRELVLAELEADPPQLESVTIAPGGGAHAWRRIFGTLRGPLVMEHGGPGAELARDGSGQVRLNGEVSFPFTAIIPTSVRDSFGPGFMLQLGHGFFGSRDEAEEERIIDLADRLHAVLFAVDWWGMSVHDIGVVVGALGEDVYESMLFAERVPQGMANWLTLSAAMRGAILEEAAFRRPSDPGELGVVENPDAPGETNAGALAYDPAHLHFLGISMGHILGGVYVALNPQVERSVLHVGGAGFTQMMFRSQPFARYLFLMDISVPDPLDQQKLTAAMAPFFERIDPATYARYVLRDELPSGPPGGREQRRVLMQAVIGDIKVPTFAAAMHARLLGIPLLTPSVREPYGLAPATSPHDGSAFAIFDMGADDAFNAEAVPPEEDLTLVHDLMREQEQAQQQMQDFLTTGTVVNPCGGPCVVD